MIASGMLAIDVIGQYDVGNTTTLTPIFTKGGANNGPNRLGFNGAGRPSLDAVGHRLFVTDTSNHRILVFSLNADNTMTDKVPDFVLGQQDFNSNTPLVTQAGLNFPAGATYDPTGQRLFVSDVSGNRIMVYNLSGGVTNGMNASNVLGQANFISSGAATTQTGLSSPISATYDSVGQRLFVGELLNNRVLVFSLSGGITDGMDASFVLGQPGFVSAGSATTQAGMSGPRDTAYDSANQRLFVTNFVGRRVLIFHLADGISNGMNASYVLGQADFTSNASVTTQIGMKGTWGVLWDAANQRLFVGDNGNNRVLQFDLSATATTSMNAARVLGQEDFTSDVIATTQNGLNPPRALAYDATNQRLFVSDYTNNREMVFDVNAITNGENAIDEIGQYDANSTDLFNTTVIYTKGGMNNGPNRIGIRAGSRTVLDTVQHRLFLADQNNSRVLVFGLNSDNTLTNRVPDYVIGQPDFNTLGTVTTQTGMRGTLGIAYDADHDRLFVGTGATGTEGARVLIFDLSGGITNGMAAQYVLGQPNFTSITLTTTQTGFGQSVAALAYDAAEQRLFVAETSNHRVTVFDLAHGIANGMPAAYVLGQANFVSAAQATSPAGMRQPVGLAFDAATRRLWVSEAVNHRVTEFDLSATTTTNMAASHVLGQPDLVTATVATTQVGMSGPRGVAYDSGSSRLFVTDSANNRVLIYNISGGTVNGMAAQYVLGQTDFVTATAAVTQTGFSNPQFPTIDTQNQRLYVADSTDNRVTVYDVATTTGTTSPTLNNSVTLSTTTASATATATVSFTLMHNLSSLLTVAFPPGFTVTAAATAGASSACLSGFGFTASTLTASKTNCAGPITLGGATVTNPGSNGPYTISWTNDDPGSASVTITGAASGGGSQPATPAVMVIQPNGGQSLLAGATYDIVWSSGGIIDSYRLSYSADGGAAWTLVASGLHGNYYLWTVPEVTTTMARIRVDALNGSGNVLATDDTDASFAITATPTPVAPRTHDYDAAKATSATASIDADLGLVAVPNPLCTPGTPIKGTRSAVYYCGIDGMRYVFPNAKTWFTWFADFSSVRVLTDAQIAAVTLGTRFATYKSGVRMVKLQTSPKVYVVAAGGVLRFVPDEQTAFDLYGPYWNTKIDDVPAPFWSSYTIGTPISTN